MAWITSVGMTLIVSELTAIGVVLVVFCNGMEDGLMGLFFDVTMTGIQSMSAIPTVAIEFVLKFVLLVAMLAVNTTRWD